MITTSEFDSIDFRPLNRDLPSLIASALLHPYGFSIPSQSQGTIFAMQPLSIIVANLFS